MDATYVKEMERLANEGRVIEKDGETFSSLRMQPVFYEPRPGAVKVRSLTALLDYLRANRDGLKYEDLILHVQSVGEVAIMSKLSGKDRQRDTYMIAGYDGTVFKFGNWYDPESFIIAVNALFIPSTGRDEILHYVSAIKVEDEGQITDDGITQTAQVRIGIKGSLTEGKAAPSRVVLVPYRTFREVEQPESEFIFRMRREGTGVQLSIHEADGGAWKAVAMERVKGYLEDELGDAIPVSVIA